MTERGEGRDDRRYLADILAKVIFDLEEARQAARDAIGDHWHNCDCGVCQLVNKWDLEVQGQRDRDVNED